MHKEFQIALGTGPRVNIISGDRLRYVALRCGNPLHPPTLPIMHYQGRSRLIGHCRPLHWDAKLGIALHGFCGPIPGYA